MIDLPSVLKTGDDASYEGRLLRLVADAMAIPGEHAVDFFSVPPPY